MEITCGIYLYSVPRNKILACHATRSPKTHWSIPKGLKDEGEDCFNAALRELYEETGIDLRVQQHTEVHLFPRVKYQKRNKWLESFLLISHEDFSHHTFVCHTWVDDKFPEVDKWEWITLEEAEKRLHESQRKNLPLVSDILERKVS